MLDKTLALTQRGLRRDTRILTNHLLRLGILVVVGFAVFGAHLGSLSVGAPGLGYFSWIAWTTLVFSSLAGATFFATTITEEKEEQTLGLLTLANIRPAALIAGKFLPRLLNSLLILTIVLPFTLLAITLGGVTWDQVWAAYWTLAAHVVFMGSIGLFFSVLCRTSGAAIAWSMIAMLVYFAGLPLASALVNEAIQALYGGPREQFSNSTGLMQVVFSIADALQWLTGASAFVRVYEILITGFNESAFGMQVVGNLGASLVLMFLSWALFGIFNRGTETSQQPLPVLDRALRFRKGSRRPWTYALAWKDFHYIAGGLEWLLIRGCLYAVVVVISALVANDFRIDFNLRGVLGGTIVVTMLIAVLIEMTILAAKLFRAEIKDGTWETLVGLPYSIPRLAYGKLAGGLIGLAPVLLILLIGAGIAPDTIAGAIFDSSGGGFMLAFGYIYYFALFLVFLHLTTLYSIIFNSWAGVLLAFVTIWFASCFTGPLIFLPFVIIGSMSGVDSGWVGVLIGAVIYGAGLIAICFGLQILIMQQLRSAAAR